MPVADERCVSINTFFCFRFDYEGLDPRAAFYLMRDLEAVISDKAFTSQKFAVGDHVYSVEKAENFEYIDPVDGSVARNQVSFRKDRKGRIKQNNLCSDMSRRSLISVSNKYSSRKS